MIELKGKYALITGSSRGIGQQIALGLAEKGCHIILHGRTQGSTDESAKLLESYSVQVHRVHGDLSDEQQIKGLINQVEALEVPVDILYNNAAIMCEYRKDIWTHTRQDWMELFQVNVWALYQLCSAFIPKMIERGFGRVVNTSSGITNEPQLAPYGASKWAVNKLSLDLAHAVKDTAVRINFLDPGWLRTDMGGPHANHLVEDVLPGALVPVLVDDDGPNGEFFSALDYRE